jgi:hypothetical protein
VRGETKRATSVTDPSCCGATDFDICKISLKTAVVVGQKISKDDATQQNFAQDLAVF